MDKIKWPEKVTSEKVLERLGEKKTLLNRTLRRNVIWDGHILRKKYLHHASDDGRERCKKNKNAVFFCFGKYQKIKEEAADRKRWK